jgi:Flp pilus assembly protein TadD
MIFVYWLLHGSIDWFWEIPALAAPAFGFLALASAPLPGPRESRAQPRRRARFGALLAAVTGAAAIALLAPWLAAAYQESAVAVWRSEPAAAYARLDRAAEINRLSGEPLVVAGVIAVRRKEYARAARLFERARTREPDNWYVHRQLGLLCVRAGEDERGLRLLERARRLNPREPSTLKALAIVRAGRPVTAAVLRLEAEPAES